RRPDRTPRPRQVGADPPPEGPPPRPRRHRAYSHRRLRHCALLRLADRDAIPQTRPRDIEIVPQTLSPRGFFSDRAHVVELEIEPRRAMAEVAANSVRFPASQEISVGFPAPSRALSCGLA